MANCKNYEDLVSSSTLVSFIYFSKNLLFNGYCFVAEVAR